MAQCRPKGSGLAAASGIGRLRNDRGRHDAARCKREGKHHRKDERLHGHSFPYSAANQLSDIAFVPFSPVRESDFVAPPVCFILRQTMKQSPRLGSGKPSPTVMRPVLGKGEP
jgi:hypothetical protein